MEWPMHLEVTAKSEVMTDVFPEAEVRRRLSGELDKVAEEASFLRPEWEPMLDSVRIVGTILILEGMFEFELPPDSLVRKGGYSSVEEAVSDMLARIQKIWLANRAGKIKKGSQNGSRR
jgi:acyl carrier protein